jgi:hypothetical protein
METSLIVNIFWLFSLFYISAFQTGLYNFNVHNLKDLIGFTFQNTFEAITQILLTLYAIYLLVNIKENKYIYIKIVLFLIAFLYFFNALSSVLLLADINNKFASWVYDITFLATFYLQNTIGLVALYLLYVLILS